MISKCISSNALVLNYRRNATSKPFFQVTKFTLTWKSKGESGQSLQDTEFLSHYKNQNSQCALSWLNTFIYSKKREYIYQITYFCSSTVWIRLVFLVSLWCSPGRLVHHHHCAHPGNKGTNTMGKLVVKFYTSLKSSISRQKSLGEIERTQLKLNQRNRAVRWVSHSFHCCWTENHQNISENSWMLSTVKTYHQESVSPWYLLGQGSSVQPLGPQCFCTKPCAELSPNRHQWPHVLVNSYFD